MRERLRHVWWRFMRLTVLFLGLFIVTWEALGEAHREFTRYWGDNFAAMRENTADFLKRREAEEAGEEVTR